MQDLDVNKCCWMHLYYFHLKYAANFNIVLYHLSIKLLKYT